MSVAKENLLQIRDLLENLTTDDYTATPRILSGATIGQHIRHILEFYLLLVSGSFSGTIMISVNGTLKLKLILSLPVKPSTGY